MGTYDDLQVGYTFTSPSRVITMDDIAALIALGGYTHPLFTDPAFLAGTPFRSTPMPGEGTLHVMGGLVEQTGRFDDTTLALTGLDEVRFYVPVVADDEVHVEIEVLAREDKDAVGLMTMRWTLRNGRGNACVVATAGMLFRR
jgi:acyl dehydratase